MATKINFIDVFERKKSFKCNFEETVKLTGFSILGLISDIYISNMASFGCFSEFKPSVES